MPPQRKLKGAVRREAAKRQYAYPNDESPEPTSSVTTSSWPPSRKLPKDAYKVLADFFYEVTEYPTLQQKHALAAQIARLEGCEGYTVARVKAYFKDKRKLAHRRAARDSNAAAPAPKSTGTTQAAAGACCHDAAPCAECSEVSKLCMAEPIAVPDVLEFKRMIPVQPGRPSAPASSPRTFEQPQTWLRAQNSLPMFVQAHFDAHTSHHVL